MMMIRRLKVLTKKGQLFNNTLMKKMISEKQKKKSKQIFKTMRIKKMNQKYNIKVETVIQLKIQTNKMKILKKFAIDVNRQKLLLIAMIVK